MNQKSPSNMWKGHTITIWEEYVDPVTKRTVREVVAVEDEPCTFLRQ